MLKKIFIACFFGALLALPAAAQQAKVLVIVRDYDISAGKTLARAIQFKDAGLDVSVIFEGKGVLGLLNGDGVLSTPAWQEKVKGVKSKKAEPDKGTSVEQVSVESDYKSIVWDIPDSPKYSEKFQQFKSRNIPYTVCSASAKLLGVYDELKAAGEPLSADPEHTVDLSPYIKGNYFIIFSS